MGWSREKELLQKYALIGLGDWDEAASQQPSFQNEMQKGDYVLIKHGGTIIALTKVIGDYFYDDNINDLVWFQRRRKVQVLDWYDEDYNFSVSSRKTLEHCVNPNTDQYKSIVSWIKKINNNMEMSFYSKLLQNNHNLILTGAPGTGKTYLAKQIAKQIIFGEIKENLNEEEEKRFNQQCGFVQFHPSYDYTDFVEGLRPIYKNGQVVFERKDGVFKEFCKRAILSEIVDKETMIEINSNPTVWKISLEGTGDNPTRNDCMENGYIRIGWPEYGDIDDFNDYEDFYVEGKRPLRAFQSGMKIGDLVVSCYTAKEIDAVGIVTGDYEYREEGGKYPRYRSVRWLVKGIRENIVEQNNGKTFTLPTVYKAKITAEAALKIVQKHVGVSKKDVNEYVFIIDEINRGEISKIFGELFFSIDPGYRGEKGRVSTQYQNMVEDEDVFKKGFYVPENVYIIGTMNDIDRSVESMDFAFRRRFAFKEIKAADRVEMLYDSKNGLGAMAGEAIRKMEALNATIEKIEGLSSAYHIGPAYFLKLKNHNGDFEKLWENHLKGLLFEYLRGTQNIKGKMEKLKSSYDNESASDNG